jgi:predicted ester cyclase
LEGDCNSAARAGGFSLHAGIDSQPGQRAKLERLCRYVSRPPVGTERLALTSSGQVRYQLKRTLKYSQNGGRRNAVMAAFMLAIKPPEITTLTAFCPRCIRSTSIATSLQILRRAVTGGSNREATIQPAGYSRRHRQRNVRVRAKCLRPGRRGSWPGGNHRATARVESASVVQELRPVASATIEQQKSAWQRAWEPTTRPAARWPTILAGLYHADIDWHGPHPINSQRGAAAVIAKVWSPLFAACPDLERRDEIVLAGGFKDQVWVAAMGHHCGLFQHDWLGIPATGMTLNIRYGEFSRMQDDRIVECFTIFDLLDVMRQARCWPDLPPSPGVTEHWPGPATRDGVSSVVSDAADSERSLRLVEAMIAGLMRYDQKSLDSMQQSLYWTPSFMWHGPAGIGTARGMQNYRDVHQQPFLAAFPDRVGGNHKCRIGDGNFVASTGWPSIRATHRANYLGQPATNKPITMRVMDFWRRDADKLAENWVFIDMPDLLRQIGKTLPLRAP